MEETQKLEADVETAALTETGKIWDFQWFWSNELDFGQHKF